MAWKAGDLCRIKLREKCHSNFQSTSAWETGCFEALSGFLVLESEVIIFNFLPSRQTTKSAKLLKVP